MSAYNFATILTDRNTKLNESMNGISKVGFIPSTLYQFSLLTLPIILSVAIWFAVENMTNLAAAAVVSAILVAGVGHFSQHRFHKFLIHVFIASIYTFFALLLLYFENKAPIYLAAVILPVFVFLLNDLYGKVFWGITCSIGFFSFLIFSSQNKEFLYEFSTYIVLAVVAAECFILQNIYGHLNQAREQFLDSLKRFERSQSTFNFSLPMLHLNLYGKITQANKAFARLSESPLSALEEQYFFDLNIFLNGFTKSMLQDAMKMTLWNEEIHGKHRNGKPFWMEVFLRKKYDNNFKHIGFTLICKDITTEKTQRMQFSHDPTTKVLSNHVFNLFISQTIHEFNRYKDDYCLMAIQVDNLTAINHRFGYQTGDELLHEMSDILNETFRKTDIISRWNGNTFAVLLTRTDEATCDLVKNKLEHNISEHCFSCDERVRVRLSSAKLSKHMSQEDWVQTLRARTYSATSFLSPKPHRMHL